jgi:glycosyltransferase involved in cell wall biosynthesis
MKIAFTSDVYWPRINGVTVSTNIFLNELTKLGHNLRLWAPAYPEPEDTKGLHHADPRVARLKSWGLFFSKEDRLVSPFQRGRFFRELTAFSPDLIHAQVEFTTSLMAHAWAKKNKVPVVQTCHTYFEQYVHYYLPLLPEKLGKSWARKLTYSLFRHADAIISPTVPMKAVLQSYGLTCPIEVIPTGIQEEDFKGTNKEDEHQHSRWILQFPQLRGRKILLFVGRVGQEKNLDFLLDVVEKVQPQVPQATLVVAGNGPYLDEFKAKIKQRNLENLVLCLGYVDRKELRHLYTLADVFTFASKTETQGLVTVEAMMCKTPAVAIGLMGTKEVMNGDNGGFMVNDDVEEFTAAVVKLLTDPALYQAKSEEAYAWAQNWTAAKMALRIEELYRQTIDQYRNRKV